MASPRLPDRRDPRPPSLSSTTSCIARDFFARCRDLNLATGERSRSRNISRLITTAAIAGVPCRTYVGPVTARPRDAPHPPPAAPDRAWWAAFLFSSIR